MTVNGKSLPEIEEMLSRRFPDTAFSSADYRDSEYLKVEVLQQRLDEVVGKLNYDLEYTEPQIVTAVSGKVSVLIGCALTVYDDDRNPVVKKRYFSASDVLVTMDGTPINGAMKQCIGSAQSFALKKVIMEGLGAGMDQIREKNAASSHVTNGYQRQFGAQGQQMRIILLSDIRRYGSVLKARCADVETEEQMDFTVFMKSFPEIESLYGTTETFCSVIKTGMIFEFLGHRDRDKNHNMQAVFDGLLT